MPATIDVFIMIESNCRQVLLLTVVSTPTGRVIKAFVRSFVPFVFCVTVEAAVCS